MKNVLGSILQKHRFAILSFIYFFLLSYWLRVSLPEGRILYNLLYSFLNAIVLFTLVILISKIPKVSLLFTLILSVFISADITHRLIYGTILTIGGISSMFETNSAEAGDFLGLYLKECILPFILTFTIIILATSELKKHTTKSIYVISSLLMALVLLMSSIMMARSEEEKVRSWEEFNISPSLFIQANISPRAPLGVNSIITSFTYWNEMRKFRKEAATPKTLVQGISYSTNNSAPQTIFLVIGESAVQTHYSLYGYKIPTTPFLDSMKMSDNLFYYQALSVAPITREALRMTLSFASPLDFTPFLKNENIVTMANMAGYDSYWISNQDKVGMHDSFVGLLASYAKESRFYRFEKDDLGLLNDVKERLNPSKKQIFFIHLKGSHLDYRDKYDNTDIKALEDYSDTNKNIDYDRSIHHTDRVLSELNYLLQTEQNDSISSVMIYYSDHGEIINKGHGIMNEGIEQFKIPFVIIPYNTRIDISQAIAPYLINGIFNSNSISYLMALILGYKIDSNLEQKARNEAEYHYHVDGKNYKTTDLEK